MSWDIFLFNPLHEIKSVEELEADLSSKPLGSRSALIAKIKDIVPTADFSDPSWGVITRDGWSIEVNIGEDDTCSDLALHVRGNGDEAIEVVTRIVEGLGAAAFDPQTGRRFVGGPTAVASFQMWRTFRDKVRN